MSRTSVQIGIAFVLLALVSAGAVWFGMQGGGQIDVDDKVVNVEKSTLQEEVNTNTRATVPNGGLRGKGDAGTPPPPPPPPQSESTTTEESKDTGSSDTETDAQTDSEGDSAQ